MLLVVCHHGGSCWGSGDRVLVVLLEPPYQTIDPVVNPIPVPKPVRSHCDVFQPGPAARLIGQAKLAGELLGGTEEVRNSFGVPKLLVSQQLLELIDVPSIGLLVAFVHNQVLCVGSHWLDKASENFVQVFIRLCGLIHHNLHLEQLN